MLKTFFYQLAVFVVTKVQHIALSWF